MRVVDRHKISEQSHDGLEGDHLERHALLFYGFLQFVIVELEPFADGLVALVEASEALDVVCSELVVFEQKC